MAATGLSHVKLTVRDLDRSLSFYRDLLGLRVIQEGTERDLPANQDYAGIFERPHRRRITLSATRNALVRLFLEQIWHQGNLNAIEEFLAPNSVRYVSHTGMSGGRDLEKEGMLCTHR